MYDVLVIGGGPAGLYAAYCLAKAGQSVAVFEEHPEIGAPVHCTGLLAAESFSRFTLPQDSVQATFRRARFHSPGGRLLSFSSAQDETAVLDRQSFDRGLACQALAAGVELFVGHRIESLLRSQRGVVARSLLADGGSRLFHGRLAVLATGAAYHLHQRLGLSLPGRFVQSAQLEVDFAACEEVEVYFGREVAPESFAWVVSFTRDGAPKAQIGLLSSRDADGHLARFLRTPVVASRVLPGAPVRYRRRPIPFRTIPSTFAERVLAVGDAAGLVKPTTGGGIYYSLLSAELAAATAAEALAAGDCSAAFLSRYQAAWQAALASEFRMGALFRCYASRLSDDQIDEAFELAASDPVARIIRDRASFNWHSAVILALWRSSSVRGFLWRSFLTGGRCVVGSRRRRATAPATAGLFEGDAMAASRSV